MPAIGEGADARQHHAIGARDVIRIAGHYDRLIVAAVARGALERLGGRVQIAGAVVDDGDAHRLVPGSGNSPMTSDGDGGPRRLEPTARILRRRQIGRRRRRWLGAVRSRRRRSAAPRLRDRRRPRSRASSSRAASASSATALPLRTRSATRPERWRRIARSMETPSRYRIAPQHEADNEIDRRTPATAGATAATAAPAGTPSSEIRRARTRSARERWSFRRASAAAHERCKRHWLLNSSLVIPSARRRELGSIFTDRGHGFADSPLAPPRDDNAYQPPSDPLVDGTSSSARGSIATAARSARARPLKQDSAIWWLFVAI